MRTSSTPRQLRLPGQAAAPQGPCNLNAMYVIHHAFRRDLDRMGRAVAATPIDDAPTWAALLERWDHFARLLHEHHSKEDEVLWPLLHERIAAAGDVESRAVLDTMEAEHAGIDPVLDEIRAKLVVLNQPRATTDTTAADAGREVRRTALAAAIGRATGVLCDHLSHEERDAVAVLQRYVSGSEWTRLEKKDLRDKTSLREILYFLPWAAEGLEPSVLSFLLGEAGLAFRVFRRLGRPRFDRLESPAFGHIALTG